MYIYYACQILVPSHKIFVIAYTTQYCSNTEDIYLSRFCHPNSIHKILKTGFTVSTCRGTDTITADLQACIEDGTVSQIVRQCTLAATAALTLA